jgi:hypothetical protein
MQFELATGQYSAQTLSESDDEVQIGVKSDTNTIGDECDYDQFLILLNT